jgi:hypothetical protein
MELRGFTISGLSSIHSTGGAPRISHNVITGNYHGVFFEGTLGGVVDSNAIFGNDQVAILGLGQCSYDTVCFNLIYDNGSYAVYYYGDKTDIQVFNNTISGIGGSAQKGIRNGNVGDMHARNNVVIGTPDFAFIKSDINSVILAENNCVFANGGNFSFSPGHGNIYADPRFIDPTAHDFALLAESPCVDAGQRIGQLANPDGSPHDIGAVTRLATAFPVPAELHYGTLEGDNILSTTKPTICWSYYDPDLGSQGAFEVEIGADTSWDVAEIWSSGTQSTTDSCATYSGPPLVDNRCYFVRVRVSDSNGWGEWRHSAFWTHASRQVHVPMEQPTITSAVALLEDGDSVIVRPGVYVEKVQLPSFAVTVKSMGGPESTFIQGITPYESAISVERADSSCIIQGFAVQDAGAGVSIGAGQGQFEVVDNRFIRCRQPISCWANPSQIVVKNNVFLNSGPTDAAILVPWGRCTFVNNTLVGAQDNTIGLAIYGAGSVVTSNIVTGYSSAIAWNTYNAARVDYNDFWGNLSNDYPGPHGIAIDPQFNDTFALDFSLQVTSPCIDAGDPFQPLDIDCTVSDIGAYPFIQSQYQTDADGDLMYDSCDNCMTTFNPGQEDSDTDGIGDSCDNCIAVYNTGQEDYDGDGWGDVCDNCVAYATPGNITVFTGDLDCPIPSGFVVAADIIYLVNFVFKGGASPCPIEAAGNVNCDAGVNAADIIYLVNLVFKSGPGPCDVCSGP